MYYLVRFPASLAFGSESGLQYPYRWGIFLCSPPEGTIVAEHGQLGAYWISEHLTKPLAQSHFCSLTGLAASTQFLSSSRSQLLPPPDRNFCWREVQVYLSSCRFRFLQCHPTWHPSWAVLVEYWSYWWRACFCDQSNVWWVWPHSVCTCWPLPIHSIPRVATAVDIIDQLSTTFKICLCTMYIDNFLDYPSQLY